MFLHVPQSILICVNKHKLVSVELYPTTYVQVFSLVVDNWIGTLDLRFCNAATLKKLPTNYSYRMIA